MVQLKIVLLVFKVEYNHQIVIVNQELIHQVMIVFNVWLIVHLVLDQINVLSAILDIIINKIMMVMVIIFVFNLVEIHISKTLIHNYVFYVQLRIAKFV